MHKPRKLALAVLASITIAGIAGASASSLGGLNSQSVGSDDNVIASCDTTGIDIAYTVAYNASNGKNEITGVSLSKVNELCNGKAATLTLRNGTASVATGTTNNLVVTGTGDTGTASFSVTPYDAELVNAVSLVIQG